VATCGPLQDNQKPLRNDKTDRRPVNPASAPRPLSRRIRVADFLHKDGVGVDSSDDRLTQEDTLINGEFLHQELRQGLFLHVSDAVEERPFTVTSSLSEGLSCIFFLEGAVDIELGGRRFEFHGGLKGALSGAAIMTTTSESFRRASRARQHVRHLVVSATPEWLDVQGLEEISERSLAAGLLRDNLADHRWTLTPHAADLVRQIAVPSAFTPELRRLHLEGRAVEIVAETIAAVMRAERNRGESSGLGRIDLMRLQRARDLIRADPAAPLSVEAIAREAGISASGLQRLFRLGEGLGVFEYVRRLRLERAFEALQKGEASVQQASVIAGYASPANFATAFRRQFGLSPREVSRPAS